MIGRAASGGISVVREPRNPPVQLKERTLHKTDSAHLFEYAAELTQRTEYNRAHGFHRGAPTGCDSAPLTKTAKSDNQKRLL